MSLPPQRLYAAAAKAQAEVEKAAAKPPDLRTLTQEVNEASRGADLGTLTTDDWRAYHNAVLGALQRPEDQVTRAELEKMKKDLEDLKNRNNNNRGYGS